jgi:GT2 family glycosyltransferase
MDLSIITVTYQSRAFIDACILSVPIHILNCSYEHIIVDNGSTDGTVELIENGYSQYVRLIKNSKNCGFAQANEQALHYATGRYLLFLNPDMQMHEGFLDSMISWMDVRPEVGVAGCTLLSAAHAPHEALRPCTFPSLSPYLSALLKFKPFFCTIHPRFFYPHFDDAKEQEVDVVRGAFMLMRRAIYDKLGHAFDTKYFILLEDVDLCHEVKRLGYKVVYTPQISCIDYFGRSFLKQTGAWKYLRLTQSLRTYARKWHSPLHLLWLYPAIILGFLLRIPEWGLKNSWKALKEVL